MREQSFAERWPVLQWLGPPQGPWGSGGRRADGERLVLRMLTWSLRGSRKEVTRGRWLQESGRCGGGDMGLTCPRMAAETVGRMRLCREDASDGGGPGPVPRAAEGSGGEEC